MHKSVLLHDSVEALNIKANGIYVDATFGRGGHSREILKKLGPNGRLLALDQDPQALEYAKTHFGEDARVMIINGNFASLKLFLTAHLPTAQGQVDGMLFDLGVSSPQLDEAERGFSFLKSGPLDMRMNPLAGQSCAEILQKISESDLIFILKTYGEEKFAKQIARAIIQTRVQTPLDTTLGLAALVAHTIPKRFHEHHKHPATRTFQALRIYVNHELDALKQVLDDFPELLTLHGRAAFISFHSLEDRMVKQKLQSLTQPKVTARGLPIQIQDEDLPRFKLYIKMLKANANERDDNPRARSATLRVVERIR